VRLCVKGLTDVVAQLLQQGVAANGIASVVYNGTADANQLLTPLLAACVTNRVDIVRLLVGHGADVNATCTSSLQVCESCGIVVCACVYEPLWVGSTVLCHSSLPSCYVCWRG
jgi:hypothetical protein